MTICKCIAMNEVLTILDAPFAAAMHLKMGADWTTPEVLIHFREEDTRVDPALRATRNPRAIEAADRIQLEHEMFRAQISIYKRIVNIPMFDEHAAFEDEVVLEFLGHLLLKGNGPAAEEYKAKMAAQRGLRF